MRLLIAAMYEGIMPFSPLSASELQPEGQNAKFGQVAMEQAQTAVRL